MKKSKSFLFLALLSSISFSNMVFSAEKSDVDDGRPLVLVDPSAAYIIRSHEQRIVNLEYEMTQVMDLINQYSAYKKRLEAGVTSLPKEMNTKTMQIGIDREIEKYWKLYNILSQSKDLLKDSPPLKIKMQKGYKDKKK